MAACRDEVIMRFIYIYPPLSILSTDAFNARSRFKKEFTIQSVISQEVKKSFLLDVPPDNICQTIDL